MIKKILHVVKFFFNLSLIIIVIINAISIYSIFILKREYVDLFGYTYFEVLTGSMRDYIKEQDFVIVKLDTDYSIGDVVTYKSGKSFITHRIVDINEAEIITKGDANNIEDEPIKKEQIIGKVVKVITGVGIIFKVITDKTIILLTILLLIIGNYILSLREGK